MHLGILAQAGSPTRALKQRPWLTRVVDEVDAEGSRRSSSGDGRDQNFDFDFFRPSKKISTGEASKVQCEHGDRPWRPNIFSAAVANTAAMRLQFFFPHI